MKTSVKAGLSHLAVIVSFLFLVVIYFSPSIIDKKVIQQGDMVNTVGMGEELKEYHEKENGISAWTEAMFAGMPAYNIFVYGNPPNFLAYVEKVVKSIDYMGASMVLTGLICFYILMCVMGVNRWLAIAGSIAFAFASYNFIIILVGHITKAYVIAYMPLTVAGLFLLFRRKYLWGSILTILGISFSLMNNHMQVTYYLALFCLFLYLGFISISIGKKDFTGLWQKSLLILACFILAVLPNIGNMYANYEMSKESMRGPSELTKTEQGTVEKVQTGLERNYAFEWSYGQGELLTLLIPNVYGGGSGGPLSTESNLYRSLRDRGERVESDGVHSYTYWGEQMFTEGPVYFGALICFLFILGMFAIRNQMKWWMLAGSVFFIFLALGRNMASFNNFMFEYLPFYNKFRTPSLALVIPGLVFPIIGMWGLKEIFTSKVDPKIFKRGLITALSVCGGICLIIWAFPDMFLNFQSSLDAKYQLPDWYYSALVQDRKDLASSDAFRSLAFIVLGAGLLFYYLKSKNKLQAATICCIGLMCLVMFDLWGVDKRYLNDESFSRQKLHEAIKPMPANKVILEDKDPSYRVLNLRGTFQESRTSFFHKSIGGYHPAKLRRYQELIDYRLSKEISDTIFGRLQQAKTYEDLNDCMAHCPSLNMLNARYLIFDPSQYPVRNPYALGNAWFVNQIRTIENADEEIAALNTLNPREEAVTDKRFASALKGLQITPDSAATITLDSYKPNILTYSSHTNSEQLAVFSEIYYAHGWEAFIDGQPAPHFRVNWILRAMRIPAGEHKIEFKFEPKTYNQANMVASVASGFILAFLLLGAGYTFWRKEKSN